MKNRVASGLACLFTVLAILFNVSGGVDSRDRTADLTIGASSITPTVNASLLSGNAAVYNDFALRLMEAGHTSENTLVSPLSTVYGLFMTANGATGETLTQIETALGMPVSQMNEYLYSYASELDNRGDILSIANSAWISESENFTINKGFLQTCATWYDTQVFQMKFDDDCLRAMNDWVRKNTDNSMASPLSAFQQEDGIVLLNTVLFDAKWATPFSEDWNDSDRFFREDGSEEFAIFMRSTEELYLENEYCTGFIKEYMSDGYVFVALLPVEGTTVSDLLSATYGHSLTSLLASAAPATVHISLPRFSADLSMDMIPALQRLGITDVFSQDLADLSGIGSNRLYIAEFRQNTTITVDEIGTRAAAVSAVAEFPAAENEQLEEKYVKLNRPFVYMILESENLTPLFIGTVMTTE